MLPGGLGRLCLALLVLIIAGFGMLVGKGIVMDFFLGLGKVHLVLFWISSCCYFSILTGLLVRCLQGSLPLRYCSTKFARRVPFLALPVLG